MPRFIGFVTGDRATGYLVDIPNVPGVSAQGSNIDAAVLNATVALREWVSARRAAGLPIPTPSAPETLGKRDGIMVYLQIGGTS